MQKTEGTLFIVGTPLGNLGDMSPRGTEALAKVDVIACEDTRRTGQLLQLLGQKAPRLVSFHKENERERLPEILALLKEGRNVALVSDGGMPGISDPGAGLVAAARTHGYRVEVVPGPTAVTTAVAGSGFAGGFRFVGFLPRKHGELTRFLEGLRTGPETLVFYESPNRVAATILAAQTVLGNRRAWLVRELTKLHEEWLGPTLAEITATLATRTEVKGECVLLIEGAGEGALAPEPIADATLVAKLKAGESVKDIAAWLAAAEGCKKSQAYARVQALKG